MWDPASPPAALTRIAAFSAAAAATAAEAEMLAFVLLSKWSGGGAKGDWHQHGGRA